MKFWFSAKKDINNLPTHEWRTCAQREKYEKLYVPYYSNAFNSIISIILCISCRWVNGVDHVDTYIIFDVVGNQSNTHLKSEKMIIFIIKMTLFYVFYNATTNLPLILMKNKYLILL